ncbi:MAG: hypothetical protein QNJ34_03515 [Xenococcaceae cyanobacterium MO_188.B29]|nr:hypothetical protein [Xenococcaceae cyanobacterium MO_188.B29]
MPSLLEVHLALKGTTLYNQGRSLAENVYRQIWGTENLLDGNDYAVVVCRNGKALGNLNIQFKHSEKSLLKSEVFFGERHWQDYKSSHHSKIAEISSLAMAQDIPKELRRPTMMTLILGIHLICCLEDINFLVTVQHDYLIRILSKSLRLPFFRNEIRRNPQGKVPNDNYWAREKSPRLYYLAPNNIQTINACASYLNYLPTTKIESSYFAGVRAGCLSYSTFPQNWNKAESGAVVYAK